MMISIWLFNIAMENPPIFNSQVNLHFYGPSKNHGYVSHNQRVAKEVYPKIGDLKEDTSGCSQTLWIFQPLIKKTGVWTAKK